jgi:hypothetical protein
MVSEVKGIHIPLYGLGYICVSSKVSQISGQSTARDLALQRHPAFQSCTPHFVARRKNSIPKAAAKTKPKSRLRLGRYRMNVHC